MRKKNQILIAFILSIFTTLSSQEIILLGSIPEYANQELIFSNQAEYITHELKELGRCKVDENGEFRIAFRSDEIIEIHLFSGIYDGTLWGEPGRTYNIKLPPPEEKSFKELCNPFFEEIGYYIGYSDTIRNDLNVKIQDIVKELDYFISENYSQLIYGIPPRNKIDSFENVISKNYSTGENLFLDETIKYKLGFLKFISRYYSIEQIASKYFYDKPIQYNNKSYMNLFNNIFTLFFNSFPHKKTGEPYGSIISNGKGLSYLTKNVKANLGVTNHSLAELIILKGLYDGFNTGYYIAQEVIPLVDSIIISSENKNNIIIAKNIKKSVKSLLSGSFAPDFELFDKDSNLVKLSELRGKYLYLNFCSYQSRASRRELSLMPGLQKKFKNKIEFVTISVDESFSEFKDLVNTNNYDWIILHIKKDPSVLKSYRVKSFPTGFLIDPYGKIILIPARLPSEDFDNQFYGILNNIN